MQVFCKSVDITNILRSNHVDRLKKTRSGDNDFKGAEHYRIRRFTQVAIASKTGPKGHRRDVRHDRTEFSDPIGNPFSKMAAAGVMRRFPADENSGKMSSTALADVLNV